MTTKRQVYDFLRRLGKDSRQVAKTLARRGVKGDPGNCAFCPIASALRDRFQASVYVGNYRCLVDNVTVPQTEACKAFIRSFDRGRYKELRG